jgi:hypothetical protein
MGKLKYKLKENTPDGIKVGDIKTGSGVKTTVTDIDSETGAVSWDVKYVPNIDKLVDDVNDLTKTAKEVSVKAKDDSKFIDIYEKSRELRNIIRTHIRNKYPEEYRKAMGVAEEVMDEISTSGGAGAYQTPFAFRLKGQKVNDKAYKELGYEEVEEGIGAHLGPGPTASEDGVKDNAYVKQFKYKLVPKDKQGNYVQKGSGLEVKNLFKEEAGQTPKQFHQERMSGFDRVGDLLGQINPLLNDAKRETEEFYKENPESYGVVYGTDLVVDYLNDILDILKDKEE